MITLIKRDGLNIGICEHDLAGLNVLNWFNKNVNTSMAHAMEHEGYSVEDADEIDCNLVEPLIGVICARIGLVMASEFVPFSRSRNADADQPSVNWKVSFAKSRPFLHTDYMEGSGHVPASKMETGHTPYDRRMKAEAVALECESGRVSKRLGMGADSSFAATGKRLDPPTIGSVMWCLAKDCDVLNAGGFESWASDLGYDTDSRKAEAIYTACLETAMKLMGGLGAHALAEIRLAASFN